MDYTAGEDEERAEMAQLFAEQRADDSDRQWPELRRSISLDTHVQSEDGAPSTIGAEFVGHDPWDAVVDAIDAGLNAVEAGDSTLLADNPQRWLPEHLRDERWDRETLYANGSATAPPHVFRDVPRDNARSATQFEQAYGTKWRRKPTRMRVAPPIVARLFEAITTAVGVDVAHAASCKRGRPTTADRRARALAALAVQVFLEMGYAPTALARTLKLPPSTITRYATLELPVLSPEAHERLFGGNATSSETTSVPVSEPDATRGRCDEPAPASSLRRTTRPMGRARRTPQTPAFKRSNA